MTGGVFARRAQPLEDLGDGDNAVVFVFVGNVGVKGELALRHSIVRKDSAKQMRPLRHEVDTHTFDPVRMFPVVTREAAFCTPHEQKLFALLHVGTHGIPP